MGAVAAARSAGDAFTSVVDDPSVNYRRGIIMDKKSFLGSFLIIVNDLRRITEFIEPVDVNLYVYSHRLHELLLRICTDFESICKEKLIEDGYTKKPDQMNIYDYKTLEKSLVLEKVEVGLLFWRPDIVYVQPFKDWSSANPPLIWYSDYNKVKHNRNTDFSKANLNNVRLAFAGLFALLAKLDFLSWVSPLFRERSCRL